MEIVTGYDCEFVDSVCKDIQTECSICPLILRQPYIVQCCGNRFCKSCLKGIQGMAALADTPCPLCKQKIAEAMPDRQLERLLNEKLVYCSNKKRGCTRSGELAKFEDDHLNENPSAPDKLMDGCMYVQVLCCQCQRVKVERCEMTNHKEKECPRRIAVCTYCKVHRAAFEDISRIHHPVCRQIPVLCPKGCGAKPLRKNIKAHVANWCPNNPQPCPFHVVGCTKKLTGYQMERHLTDWTVYEGHLSNMEKTVAALKKDIREKDSRIKILQEKLNVKDVQVSDLLSEVEKKELHMRMLAEQKDKLINTLKEELVASETQMSILEDQAEGKEHEVKALQEELDVLKEVYLQKIKEKTAALSAALSERDTAINSFSGEVKERDKQIEKLKKKIAHEEQVANKLKNENTELQKCTNPLKKENLELRKCIGPLKKEIAELRRSIGLLERENAKCTDLLRKENAEYQRCVGQLKKENAELRNCPSVLVKKESAELRKRINLLQRENVGLQEHTNSLEARVGTMKAEVMDLKHKAHSKAVTADSLERQVIQLRQNVRSQKDEIQRLTKIVDQAHGEQDSLKKQITELKQVQKENDIRESKVTELQEVIKAQQSEIEQLTARLRENPPADDNGAWGAAASVAVGVGIAGLAALARSFKQ